MIPANITYINNVKPNYQYICNINQMDMLSQLEKLPTTIYYILLLGLILFTIYIFFIHKQRDFIIIPYLLILSATFFYTFLTYRIDTNTWNKIEPILWILAGIMIFKILLNKWRKQK